MSDNHFKYEDLYTESLSSIYVEKPWGREDISTIFPEIDGTKVGEVWFESSCRQNLPLLVKYIFTSQHLSIQVHPNDSQAQAKGYPCGKEEIWYVLECASDAKLGIGLTTSLSPEVFREAAQDGTLEQWIDWKPVKAGDCYFIPAGTVHAIGAGITLVEVQQNVDVTYRLYDYGRPRELHLEDGIAVSLLAPYTGHLVEAPIGQSMRLIGRDEAPFSVDLVHWEGEQSLCLPDGELLWFTPLCGVGTVNGQAWKQGDCLLLSGDCLFSPVESASVLLARPR